MRRLWDRSKNFVVVAGLILLVFMVLDFNQRMSEMIRVSGERDKMATQVAHLQATEQELQSELSYANSSASVERWAREDAHMVKPGDHAIILLADPNATPVPTPIVIPEQKTLSNWDVWNILFFGK